MSQSGEEESTLQELVIIRRRSGDEEGVHKGGVWKIAYADFMTAMMAFFLVMWLINATDKKVLTQVATYFNPLRLTDKAPTPRGLHDSDTGAPGSENAPGQSKTKDGKAKGAKLSPAQQKLVEDALFNDPYGALEALAQQVAGRGNERPQPSPASRAASLSKVPGEAFRDPFDPEVRPASPHQSGNSASADRADGGGLMSNALVAATVNGAARTTRDAAEASESGGGATATPGHPMVEAVPGRGREGDLDKEKDKKDKDEATHRATVERPDQGAVRPIRLDSPTETKDAADRKVGDEAETAKLDAEIKQALGPLAQGLGPGIEVTVTEDGHLISLTDKYDFGMFAIASAEPRPAMVAVMERIAKVLQARAGQLVIRGHTDGRPFRSSTYDNWRLSTARAHMAYYMLVRGGLDEKRFERVEGHADRSLRVPTDPEAAQNRRIELLLRKPKP